MNEYIFNYNQYKKTINHNKGLSFYFLFVIIIVLLSTIVFIKPEKEKIFKYYFVEVDRFSTYQNALNLSQEINSNGGAGYIYFDGEYHVLASFYTNYDNAEKVATNLKNDYHSSCVFTIKTKPFSKQSHLSKNQNLAIENLLDTSENVINNLEHSSNQFDKNELTFSKLQVQVENLNDQFYSTYETFLKHFKTNSQLNIATDYAKRMTTSLNNIKTNDEQNISSHIRYELINFVITRHQFLSCF